MKAMVASVTRRGQVTIPADLLRQLGIASPGKVQFLVDDDGRVELRPVRHTIESLRGIVPALGTVSASDFDTQIHEAMEEAAEEKAARQRARASLPRSAVVDELGRGHPNWPERT